MPSDITIGESEVQKTSYCVEVDVESFLALIEIESSGDQIPWEDHLLCRLGDIPSGFARDKGDVEGVFAVEYDGHFGPAIFFSVEAEDDTPELHAKVREIIRDQLETAVGFKNNPNAGSGPWGGPGR